MYKLENSIQLRPHQQTTHQHEGQSTGKDPVHTGFPVTVPVLGGLKPQNSFRKHGCSGCFQYIKIHYWECLRRHWLSLSGGKHLWAPTCGLSQEGVGEGEEIVQIGDYGSWTKTVKGEEWTYKEKPVIELSVWGWLLLLLLLLLLLCGPGSVVGRATAYGLDGPGIESRWGEIFRISPDRPWGPPSLLYNGYRVFPGGKVLPGGDADPFSILVQRSKIEESYTSTLPKDLRGLWKGEN